MNDIARKLVENYPEHGFIIDEAEARSLGLRPKVATPVQHDIMRELSEMLEDVTAVGRLVPLNDS